MADAEVTGTSDSVDAILAQWREERPDLRTDRVGIITRLARVRAHLDSALAQVFAGYDLSPADFQALVTLRRSGAPYTMGQADLMRTMGLTSGTISLRLARLEQRGVVPDEQDQLADLLRKLLASFEHTGPAAARAWGMTLEPAHTARRRRAAVGLSDRPGLLVTHTQPGSPAHGAAIHAGDLITACDEQPVRTPADLKCASGCVTLTLLRGESTIHAKVHLTPETA